ncbi:13874_t:CDS:1, partial [Entrophospora sp. SA101]
MFLDIIEDVSRKSYLSSLEYELERLKTLDKGKALEGVKYANVPESSINNSKVEHTNPFLELLMPCTPYQLYTSVTPEQQS